MSSGVGGGELKQLFIKDKKAYCDKLYTIYSWKLPLPDTISRHQAFKSNNNRFPVKSINDGIPELWYDVTEVGRYHYATR